ncbi:RNA-directed DNA polymerase [bacterium endosymbiont of Bathymodiolus sp. 5 South]|uniref:RNA-directed DNA polymerase n=1 Tax=bacterium endosymbiont of Bathymodiolus sp. 5 South TaxID=1181670 RepID=UPI0010B13862|nr:RNA-directed DNA polymerase [bacterium endosymbiont of Bathymodiolus sp. 5 South]SSC08384.1 FIG00698572: hypothetical protein [bacterium endosymbiont of Bathymodiolus sp. 5 South]
MSKTILQLDHKDAKEFFLREESYTSVKLPSYIKFSPLIEKISAKLDENLQGDKKIYRKNEKSKWIYPIYQRKDNKGNKDNNECIYPSNYENVNYKLFTNKDGQYAWRLFQLIHPVLYVDLVHKITEEENWNDILSAFEDFQQNEKIVCASIPVVSSEGNSTTEQIQVWSKQVEQKSIELGLEYDYIFHTDIVDCYGAIYTHSIPWAIHTQEFAKRNRRGKKCIGNIIDTAMQGMNYGQTNGIPQGSVLMDFIAEMVLGYIDERLSECLDKNMNYHIIRYRDDYRIFTNNKKEGNTVIGELSKILSEMGMRLNGEKTYHSDDIVNSSIKKDKLHQIIHNYQQQNDLKKQLLVIKNLADNYPNSGSLNKALNNFDKDLGHKIKNKRVARCIFFITQKPKIKEQFKENYSMLVSILVDIALKNPKIYSVFVSILSKIICDISNKDKEEIIKKILKKFKDKPNSEDMHLWLQRIAIVANIGIDCEGELFKLVERKHNDGNPVVRQFDPIPVTDDEHFIWNSESWLDGDFYQIIKDCSIIDTEEIDNLSCVIENKEVNSFYY